MRVLLARHGETEWNSIGRRQGQFDSALTDRGRDHADQIASLIDGEDLDMICASPLGRARETAEIIAKRWGGAVRVFDNLAELHHGTFAGFTNSEIEAQSPGALQRRAENKYTWRFPDGESYEDLDRRAAMALRQIGDAGSAAPLIISHAMISRMLLRNLIDLDPEAALGFNLPHGKVLEVRPGNPSATSWLTD